MHIAIFDNTLYELACKRYGGENDDISVMTNGLTIIKSIIL